MIFWWDYIPAAICGGILAMVVLWPEPETSILCQSVIANFDKVPPVIFDAAVTDPGCDVPVGLARRVEYISKSK